MLDDPTTGMGVVKSFRDDKLTELVLRQDETDLLRRAAEIIDQITSVEEVL